MHTIFDACRCSPDHHIAVLQRHALHRIAPLQAAPEERGRKAERHRDDGRRQVGLVVVAVQREFGAEQVAVDKAGVGFKPEMASGVRQTPSRRRRSWSWPPTAARRRGAA